ncbi:type II toxin-antitoxin system RelE/ParE family toxin [Enterobacteriaceae bacterium H20N1]|uniref:Type II toxin-antitoxin system RelE/ParE family toxin n=1 Tax=Dryocola boscaweniae TaxID=2925397 RepID=A0A9X3APB5_9ENTR|nr:type II toxin-antitoxin system RelE/ParE family toxin [Dryocola boscaweniae]MCT4703912.1 type II toxin-antitoxin system RelE/ParE family toxin [Dryocola boscaweniae]MCT4721080.1 type II toxin-antitoxin system RelE/ParE family toxin [Dryocola boscaweniae]
MDDKKFVIKYTQTAKDSIGTLVNFLKSAGVNLQVISATLDCFEKKVKEFPQGCQVCPALLKLGCAKYRECNTEEGYRILYSVDDTVITVHVMLAQRQDIKQLLFKRLIQA